MNERDPLPLDVTCSPDGGGCNDGSAETYREDFGGGVEVLYWPCGHAHVSIRDVAFVPTPDDPRRSHETRYFHPADTRDALTEALEWIEWQGLRVGLEETR